MASTGVFALTRFTALASGDILAAVDISDSTQNAHGSLDSITVQNFFGSVPVPIISTTAQATPGALSATQFTAFASTVSGAVLMGYGTTGDVTLKNRAGADVLLVGPNTTVVTMKGAAVVAGGSLSLNNSTAVVGIGTTAVSGKAVYVVTALSGNVIQEGLHLDAVFGSDATTSGAGAYISGNTTAASYTMTSAYTAYIADWGKGAGSTITTQYGVYIAAQTKGGTNWGLYVAANAVYLGGAVSGVTTLAMSGDLTINTNKFVVTASTGATAIAGALTATSAHFSDVTAVNNAALDATTALNLTAGAPGTSSLRIPHGAAPTSPVNGDVWTTTSGLFIRINGVTKTVTLT